MQKMVCYYWGCRDSFHKQNVTVFCCNFWPTAPFTTELNIVLTMVALHVQVSQLTSGPCLVLAMQRDNAVLAFDSTLGAWVPSPILIQCTPTPPPPPTLLFLFVFWWILWVGVCSNKGSLLEPVLITLCTAPRACSHRPLYCASGLFSSPSVLRLWPVFITLCTAPLF